MGKGLRFYVLLLLLVVCLVLDGDPVRLQYLGRREHFHVLWCGRVSSPLPWSHLQQSLLLSPALVSGQGRLRTTTSVLDR